MALSLYHFVIDAHDVAALSRWWARVLDYRVLFEAEDEVIIGTGEHDYPGLCFVPVGEPKAVKNRLHIDLAPDDQAAEVARVEALGARRVDVGQDPGVPWAVLADPEGNEFCILSPKRSLIDSVAVPLDR